MDLRDEISNNNCERKYKEIVGNSRKIIRK